MRHLLLILIFFSYYPSFSQESSMLEQAHKLRFSNKDSSLLLARQAYSDLKGIGNEEEFRSIELIYQIHNDRMDLDSAYVWSRIGLHRAEQEDSKFHIYAFLLHLAIGKRNMSELDSAMYYLNKVGEACIDAYEKECFAFYHERGTILDIQKRFEEAETNFIQALRIAEENNNFIQKIMARISLMGIYQQTTMVDSFSLHLEELLKLIPPSMSKPGTLSIHGDMSVMFEDPENISFFESTLESHLEQKNYESYFMTASNLINYYNETGAFARAEQLIEQVLKILDEKPTFQRSQVFYYLLYENKLKAERHEEAVGALHDYIEKNTAFIQKETQEKTAELQVKYETEKKEKEIEKANNSLLRKAFQQKMTIGIFSIVFISGLLLFYFLKRRNDYKQQLASQEIEIQSQQIKTLEKEKKILSLAAMIAGQETERKRIAKDLHDSLGGLLATAKLQLQSIQNEIEKLTDLQLFSKAEKLIDNAHEEVRRISHNMMPEILTNMGLPAAIEDLAENINSSGGIKVRLYFSDKHLRLEETQEIVLYRVVQEIINNTLKHADADNIIIQMTSEDNTHTLTIEDDGKGFDLEKVKAEKGMGLRNIESRVNFLNGKLDLQTSIGGGTSYQIQVPVKGDPS